MTNHLDTKGISFLLGLTTLLFSLAVNASPDSEVDGYLNPTTLDERYYLEQLDRFPDRLGLVCWASYEIHKEGRHDHAQNLLHACADRGLVVSMLMLANMYEAGTLTAGEQPELAALWLKRAAATGDSRGQFYYGQLMRRGYGLPQNEAQGREWISISARQGNSEAQAVSAQWN